jgi:cytosolic carboxypeptidase protein 2/3
MEGTLDFILGSSSEAEYLRQSNTFVIIPMINPDGVVHGNYRCNLYGVDLNRNWHNPSKELHDSVYYVRDLVKNLSKQGQITLIVDLHGHSKK